MYRDTIGARLSDVMLSASEASLSSFKSYPAQKLPPIPCKTMALTDSSLSKSCIAWTSSSAVAELTQFLFSGRLIPTVPTDPILSTKTSGPE